HLLPLPSVRPEGSPVGEGAGALPPLQWWGQSCAEHHGFHPPTTGRPFQNFTASIRPHRLSLPLSYTPVPPICTVEEHGESVRMDVVYLLFSLVLFAASIGFLLICDRLGRRP